MHYFLLTKSNNGAACLVHLLPLGERTLCGFEFERSAETLRAEELVEHVVKGTKPSL